MITPDKESENALADVALAAAQSWSGPGARTPLPKIHETI